MSSTLNVQKKRIVEYQSSGWFNYGVDDFQHIMWQLDVIMNCKDENGEEFEINRESLANALEKAKTIANGDVPKGMSETNMQYFCKVVEEADMTYSEVVDCITWLLEKSDQNHDWIFVSFF